MGGGGAAGLPGEGDCEEEMGEGWGQPEQVGRGRGVSREGWWGAVD